MRLLPLLLRAGTRIVWLGLWIAVAPHAAGAETVSTTTYAEFSMFHQEQLEVTDYRDYTDGNEGQTGTDFSQVSGSISAEFGVHELIATAFVGRSPAGAPKLRVSSLHAYELTGQNPSHHIWERAGSNVVARVTMVDDLSLANVPADILKMTYYWQVTGRDVSVIDISGGETLLYNFSAKVTFQTKTNIPSGEPVMFEQTVRPPGGELEEDLHADKPILSEIVETTAITQHDVGSFIESTLEVTPLTHLVNDASVRNLSATGYHSTEVEKSATLLGVVIRDEQGQILPNAQIISAAGYHYTNNWQSSATFDLPLQGYVDFDLGDFHRFDQIAIWSLSPEHIEIFAGETPTGPWESAGDFTLTNKLSYAFSYDPEILELTRPFDARYLRIEIDSAYFYSGINDFTYAIIGEVAVRALPEPSRLALGIAALASLVLLARRRQRRDAALSRG